jgi:hypothetical protein
MCLSKTKTTEAEAIQLPQTGYQMPTPYIEDYSRRLLASAYGAPGLYEGLISRPAPIPIQQTAGLTPLERMARQQVGAAGMYQPAYRTAAQLMEEQARGYRGSTRGFDPRTGISPYYDPYETDVVEDTLERMRRQSAQQDIAGRAQDISSGAFGGSRARLFAGERQAESERGILGALAGIRGQGFQRAQEAAMNEHARRQEAQRLAATGYGGVASGVLGMGGQRQQEMMNQLQMMEQLGMAGRGIADIGLQRQYEAAQRMAQEPYQRLTYGQGILSGLPGGALSGGVGAQAYQPQSYQRPTGLGQLASLGMQAWGISASDIRLKESVEYLGKSSNGHNIYTWSWNDKAIELGIDDPTTGVLAQEIMKTNPDAVTKGTHGYYVVNYNVL